MTKGGLGPPQIRLKSGLECAPPSKTLPNDKPISILDSTLLYPFPVDQETNVTIHISSISKY